MGQRVGIIGGSGVCVEGRRTFDEDTPFGSCRLSCLDDHDHVIFANRHACATDQTGQVRHAPPHEVNFQSLVWALVVKCKCTCVVALASTGTLHVDRIPVGSVVMADDYHMVKPDAITFWGQAGVGSFEKPADGVGRIHYTPANPTDTQWTGLRKAVQRILAPVVDDFQVPLATGQTRALWPCVHSLLPGTDHHNSVVYVNTVGPRFETRAEIRSYQSVGHVVGMTCGNEWALCEELCVPYCVICFCDNACNGLSTHPQGAFEEYKEHKKAVGEVTSAVVAALARELPKVAGTESTT